MDIDDRNNTNSLPTQTSKGLNMSFLIVGIRVHARSELEFSMVTLAENLNMDMASRRSAISRRVTSPI